jgi:hypothetical protein
MTLSPQMKKVAIAGGALVVVLLLLKVLVLHPKATSSVYVPPAVHHPVVHHAKAAPKAPAHHARTAAASHARKAAAHPARKAAAHRAHPARPKIDPTLPAALRRALAHSRVVVAVLYAPDAPGDGEAVDAARAGAHAARVGFVMLNVRNETVARAVAKQVAGTSDPALLVFRRPGTVALKIDGHVDAEAVAQAAANVRR